MVFDPATDRETARFTLDVEGILGERPSIATRASKG